MPLKDRLSICKYYFFRSSNNVGIYELLRFALNPTCKIKAKKFIKKIEKKDSCYEITLKNIENKLYWPGAIDLHGLYQVISESFSREAWNWHYYEMPETKVNKGDIVVDCGAAEGLFSLLIASRCKEVYAVEPLPQFVRTMQMQFSKFNNVFIVPKALGSESGSAYINEASVSSSISATKGNTKVDITTIDELFFSKDKKIDYIKADLEGYEILMIKGALNTIKKYKPKIAITTYHTNQDYKEILSLVLGIVPEYKWKIKGIEERVGNPVMLHMWCETKNVVQG